ncbi:MAG TPA: hypothetical protein VHH11_16400 [Gammaproteobacteria bacterium]|nr:hypothetical protein [Gammaproteobacteria bacterium]
MRRFAFASAYSLAVAGLLAWAGVSPAATVTLKDGTVIQGAVQSLHDGVYTIETDSVGTLHVRAEQVRSIDEGGKTAIGTPAGAASPGADALEAAKARIEQDPGLLAAVLSLQNDPEVLAVLSDPDIMKEVASGDYAALLNNPKIVALMSNAKLRGIIGQMH